nr:MAG TPA: hypothetical protein [Caudoviricetes sp.]
MVFTPRSILKRVEDKNDEGPGIEFEDTSSTRPFSPAMMIKLSLQEGDSGYTKICPRCLCVGDRCYL